MQEDMPGKDGEAGVSEPVAPVPEHASSPKQEEKIESTDQREADAVQVMNAWRFVKTHYVTILLIAFVMFGLFIRVYHLDYPAIGYHNWKEAHYLTEARNFAEQGFFEHGVFVPYRDWAGRNDPAEGVHSDTFPSMPILGAVAFSLVGNELWAARLIGVLFVVGSIPLMYLLVNQVFKRKDIALLAAALMTINPMLVFFSRNFQLVNFSLFFMFLGLWLFERWREERTGKLLIFATFAIIASSVSKYTFAVVGIFILLRFPYKDLRLQENKKLYATCVLITLLFVGWFLYSNSYVAGVYGTKSAVREGTIQLGKVFDPAFQTAMKAHILDNYTNLLFGLSLLGIIPAFLLRKKTWFPLMLAVFSVIFVVISASKMQGHSYHHYPLVLVTIILGSLFIVFVGDNVRNIAKTMTKSKVAQHAAFAVVVVGAFLLIYSPSVTAWERQFDTQFPGLDIAGEYILEHKQPGETLIHSSHQAFGIMWHGDIVGSRALPANLDHMRVFEEDRNAQWMFIYQWDFNRIGDNDWWNHVRDNYRLVQMGVQATPQGNAPVYFLLKRGGTFNESEIGALVADKPVLSKQYERTSGPYTFQYVNLE